MKCSKCGKEIPNAEDGELEVCVECLLKVIEKTRSIHIKEERQYDEG